MTTCEHCGADAVDDQGICRSCGWDAAKDSSSPSLGETRAADIADVATASAQTGRTAAAQGPYAEYPERTVGLPRYGGVASQPVSPGRPTTMSASSPTSRFCGACGARITGNEAFCGQCGTPVGATSGGNFGTILNPIPNAPGRYPGSNPNSWSGAQGDAPTEAFAAPVPPPVRALPSNPYSQAGYAPGPGMPPSAPQPNTSRTVRIVFGILCILGSLASAGGAVFLASGH